MNRAGMRGAALLALLLAVGCSRGSGRPLSSSPAPTTTSTLAPTTATLSPDEAVKAAYLAYWAMVDRIYVAPNPDDAEIERRAIDPLASMLRDELATAAAKGESFVVPPGRPNAHRLDSVVVTADVAVIQDCWLDGTIKLDRNGAAVDDGISTRTMRASAVRTDSEWRLDTLTQVSSRQGENACAES